MAKAESLYAVCHRCRKGTEFQFFIKTAHGYMEYVCKECDLSVIKTIKPTDEEMKNGW